MACYLVNKIHRENPCGFSLWIVQAYLSKILEVVPLASAAFSAELSLASSLVLLFA